jgi:hypothetical protein
VISKSENPVVAEIGRWLSLNNIASSAVTIVPLSQSVMESYKTQKSNSKNGNEGIDVYGKFKIANISAPNSTPMAPVRLFELLAPSIYVVTATRSNGDELQGSAVAVSSDILLTNCHVVANSDSIVLTRNDLRTDVSLISADVEER